MLLNTGEIVKQLKAVIILLMVALSLLQVIENSEK
jgi:hypothetical protein